MRTSHIAHLLAALLIGLSGLTSALAADGIWNLPGNGNWFGTPPNWAGSIVPGATSGTDNTDKATFGSLITAARTITLTNGMSIRDIEFAGNSFAYTFSAANTLNLTDGGMISVTGGGSNTFADRINSFVVFQNGVSGFGNYTFDSSSSNAGHTLTFDRSISGNATIANTTILTLAGTNAGANVISGVINDGTNGGKLGITKVGAGTWAIGKGNNM